VALVDLEQRVAILEAELAKLKAGLGIAGVRCDDKHAIGSLASLDMAELPQAWSTHTQIGISNCSSTI
jgi:hypothetical protein